MCRVGKIPLVLSFHPSNFMVRDMIRKKFHILKNDPETSSIFSNSSLISTQQKHSRSPIQFIAVYMRNRHHLRCPPYRLCIGQPTVRPCMCGCLFINKEKLASINWGTNGLPCSLRMTKQYLNFHYPRSFKILKMILKLFCIE